MVEITQYALKGQKLLAQGSALGYYGRIADCYYTQGVALGCELLPFQGVLLKSFWIFSGRASRTGRNIL